jgi:hypothetical protein
MDMIERVARALALADMDDETAASVDLDAHMKFVRQHYTQLARAAIEASGYATLEAALRTIQSAIPGYLKQKMTAEEFALIVIGAIDSNAVNQALGRGADNQDAPLSPINPSEPPRSA